MNELDPKNLTWTCWVCREVRPDDKISVATIDTSEQYDLAPGTMKVNTNYCNDRPECEAKARARKAL